MIRMVPSSRSVQTTRTSPRVIGPIAMKRLRGLEEFSIDPEYVQSLILQAMGLDPEMVPEWF